MFAYCLNKPIIGVDKSGYSYERVTDCFGHAAFLLNEDIEVFNWDNASPKAVLESNFFSAYNNKLALKLPIGYYGVSFGIMGIGNKVTRPQVVVHEYGHTQQLDKMKVVKYTVAVAIPSLASNILDRHNKLTYEYYSYPWEADANERVNLNMSKNNKPKVSKGSCDIYWAIVDLLFE